MAGRRAAAGAAAGRARGGSGTGRGSDRLVAAGAGRQSRLLPASSAAEAPGSKNGSRAATRKGKTAELVVEEIRRVAKERAAGMTLDSPIIETGLDSLERMEILASLEERFGGRFPPEVLPELETTRHVIEAVEKYLGGEPRADGGGRNGNPPGSLSHRTLPRIPAASPPVRHAGVAGRGQPVLHRPPGNHQRPHDHRRPRVRELHQLQLRRHVGRSGGGEGRQGRHRPLRHERFREPTGLRREGVARRVGADDRPLPRRRGGASLRRRSRHERDGHRPSRRPGRPRLARRPGAQQHRPGGDPFRGAAAAVYAQRPRGRRARPGPVPRRVSPRADRRRGRLQHGRRHPRSAQVDRPEEAAQGPLDGRRGPFLGRARGNGPRHRRTLPRRSPRR